MPPELHLSSAPRIQGWCPGALRPMPSGDGLVVRIRPPCGRLTQVQARGIAILAARYALPALDITGRANLQLRGIAEADHSALTEGLRSLGLTDPSIEVESRRNLLLSPFWQEGDGTADMAGALSLALAQLDAPALPGKFGFALDCGATPVLRSCSADIRIERSADSFLVYADTSHTGAQASANEIVPLALSMAQWFVDAGGVQVGRGRMATLLSKTPIPGRYSTTVVPVGASVKPPLGRVPQGCVVGFEFGQLQVQTLAALAELAPLRLTPWRSVLLEGIEGLPDISAVAAPSALSDVITRADDVRLRVTACTGAPGCTQALAATRPLARTLAPLVPPGRSLHVSGCTKGCAHPGATLTLVASAAGYNFIEHGTAASSPDEYGLSPAAIATHLEQRQHAPHV